MRCDETLHRGLGRQLGDPETRAPRIIAECDENLCGTRLSPAEVAMFTAERKRAYEAKFPETTKGAAQAIGMNQKLGHNVSANLSPTFTADTAAKTGASERQVQRHAERGEKVCAEALALIRAGRQAKVDEPGGAVDVASGGSRADDVDEILTHFGETAKPLLYIIYMKCCYIRGAGYPCAKGQSSEKSTTRLLGHVYRGAA